MRFLDTVNLARSNVGRTRLRTTLTATGIAFIAFTLTWLLREQPLRLLSTEPLAGLPQQGVDEEAAAHANPPVDPPHRQLHACFAEDLMPG